MLSVLGCLLLALCYSGSDGNTPVRRFFVGLDTPLNLSIARIVLFLFLYGYANEDTLVNQAQISLENWRSPIGLAWVGKQPWFDETFVRIISRLLAVSCLLASVGFFSRLAVAVATTLALYLFGVGHFDGKVDHGLHPVIWVAILLSFSPCDRGLSIDECLRGFFRKRSLQSVAHRSVAYSLPIKLIWLLFGVLYFFPGFWKVWTCGFDWALSDNIRNQMFVKWHQLGNWLPPVRVDRFSRLCQLAALGTIIFEVGFAFAIFHRWGRVAAWFGGLAFHKSVAMIMNIHFRLTTIYLLLIDWAAAGRWIGRRLGRQSRMVVVAPDALRLQSCCVPPIFGTALPMQ
ncbi:hypothetical protein SH139x_003070 [Planctomycetaceae bacterium SH139]